MRNSTQHRKSHQQPHRCKSCGLQLFQTERDYCFQYRGYHALYQGVRNSRRYETMANRR